MEHSAAPMCGAWRARRIRVVLASAVLAVLLPSPAYTGQLPATFKLAYWNIKSGRGQVGLPGRPVLFADTGNCTDPGKPLNAWGVGLVQEHLRNALSDPAVVALGLGEAWPCATPTQVRKVLGWAAESTGQNGVAILARHGFAGPEEWLQLDTSLNVNPWDTMWVLRVPVCLDAACTTAINVFTAHWYAESVRTDPIDEYNAVLRASYDRQAAQTVEFLRRAGGAAPHVLIGDLNTWEGTVRVCEQDPINIGLGRLRDAGYIDAWPRIHGTAEGFTGMTNRPGCGTPEGYVWKRPDYVWSHNSLLPLSIRRFGTVTPGHPSPSDHYGLVAEFPWPPGATPPPPPTTPTIPAGPGDIVLHARHAAAIAGSWRVVEDSAAASGARLWNPDAGVPKLASAAASPANYFDLSFTADAGRAYRLWIRGRAERDSWSNDSVFVQFSGSVDRSGAPVFRTGTTHATIVSIEAGSGAGLAGWGWQDNGYDSLGPLVYFAASGPQTVRVQQREDGVSIDQLVLSPASFLDAAPGAAKNDATIYTATSAGAPAPPPPPPPPAPAAGEVVLKTANATVVGSGWRRESDATAAGGVKVRNPDAGVPKLASAAASPASYVELTFTAEAGRAYRLWIRGRADQDYWTNDSVFVQFSGTVDQYGAPVFRIGTTGATVVSIEEGSGKGLAGWGWQDNGYDSLGPLLYFAVSGPQTIRIQQREDGVAIDQIVLSPSTYLTGAPGAPRNDTTILQ